MIDVNKIKTNDYLILNSPHYSEPIRVKVKGVEKMEDGLYYFCNRRGFFDKDGKDPCGIKYIEKIEPPAHSFLILKKGDKFTDKRGETYTVVECKDNVIGYENDEYKDIPIAEDEEDELCYSIFAKDGRCLKRFCEYDEIKKKFVYKYTPEIGTDIVSIKRLNNEVEYEYR